MCHRFCVCVGGSVKNHVKLSLSAAPECNALSLDSMHIYLLSCLARVFQLYAFSKHRVHLSVRYVSPCSVLVIHVTGTLGMGAGPWMVMTALSSLFPVQGCGHLDWF